jgi:3-isopropylmalate/(R)-2-methylmalate dehydratase small subunit
MEKLTVVTAPAAVLLRQNIDTDIIIRIERLIDFGRTELGPYCFEALRKRPDGSDDPAFFLNDPAYRGAQILLAGRNFGCGSSREGAVWALMCHGIRVVVAPSFGDIFFNNCFQNGVLPIVLDTARIEALAARVQQDPQRHRLTVDLVRSRLHFAGDDTAAIDFTVDPNRRDALLTGLDEIGATLQRDPEITAFQARDQGLRPWVYDLPA